VNWGGTDEELFFNDVDVGNWKAFAWKLNPLDGTREKMAGPVYHASPDGGLLISADPTKMRITQPGYGVRVPRGHVRRNVGAAEDTGFFLTDTRSGKCRLLFSVADILARASPNVPIENPSDQEIYAFHCKFNPQGTRLMLSLRWFPRRPRSVRALARIVVKRLLFLVHTGKCEWGAHALACRPVRFAWVTCHTDGTGLRCAIGPDQWEKTGHHATWYEDGERISMNLDIKREGRVRFVSCRWDGSDIGPMREDVEGSGHPTVVRRGRFILTDAYTRDTMAFGDGTVPLRWVDVERGSERCLVRMNTKPASRDVALRVDMHPAWDRTGRYVIFNGVDGGSRRVYIADMQSV
jgi:hypothetical protein